MQLSIVIDIIVHFKSALIAAWDYQPAQQYFDRAFFLKAGSLPLLK